MQFRSRVCSAAPCSGLSRQSKTCNTQVCLGESMIHTQHLNTTHCTHSTRPFVTLSFFQCFFQYFFEVFFFQCFFLLLSVLLSVSQYLFLSVCILVYLSVLVSFSIYFSSISFSIAFSIAFRISALLSLSVSFSIAFSMSFFQYVSIYFIQGFFPLCALSISLVTHLHPPCGLLLLTNAFLIAPAAFISHTVICVISHGG